jgi:hypothetical protein
MTATRYDRLADRYGEGTAQWLVERQDRRYWALYRTLDLSQSEVQETVKSYADTSQATVSRATREGDDRVLTEDDYIDLGGGYDIEAIRDEYHPEAWFEAYRDVLATAVTDSAALEIIADDQRLTPEWAAHRFPELVGCHHHVADYFDDDIEDFANDDHLNRLESVNTDKWK